MWRGGCIIRSALPGQDQGGLRPEPEADEPAARPVLRRRDRHGARPAGGGRSRAAVTHGIPLPAMSHGPGLLRRLPHRPAAGQPAPGPARLLRRPHLRAHRQAARPVLPHQLDRPRRHHVVDDLQRLSRRRARRRSSAVAPCSPSGEGARSRTSVVRPDGRLDGRPGSARCDRPSRTSCRRIEAVSRRVASPTDPAKSVTAPITGHPRPSHAPRRGGSLAITNACPSIRSRSPLQAWPVPSLESRRGHANIGAARGSPGKRGPFRPVALDTFLRSRTLKGDGVSGIRSREPGRSRARRR